MTADTPAPHAPRLDDAALDADMRNLCGYQLRAHVQHQSGAGTNAPTVVFADADYEVGDGSCGLHADSKSANEPAIVYVRADAIAALRARVGELEAMLSAARRDALKEAVAVLPDGDVKIELEHVHGGWCGYVFVIPQNGPIVPVDREHLYARTEAMPTRAEAVAALPDAFAAILAAQEPSHG